MSAIAELPANANPPSTRPVWLQRLSALDNGQRLRLGGGVALLVGAVLVALMLNRQPDYKVLFSNLSDKDGGAIVAQLAQMNVPYKYTEGGGAILIPTDRVHDIRLRLASQGLPKGSVSGFEITETNRFGTTQFQERLNFQRGLEGELTRSIQSLASVQSARVHLALPNQNGFFREQQKPSASVLVSLYPGRMLDKAQLAGIVHLVAASVPELEPSAVSVLDDTGKLLSKSPDGSDDKGFDAQQLMYVQQIEQMYTKRVMDILEPVVGRDNVKAQVTAEIDFSRTESTQEQHRPNQSTEAGAIRSQQVLESTNQAEPVPPTGIPGAATNQPQPPQPAAAPINGPNPSPAVTGTRTATTNSKRESITNYEVDKTVRVTRGNSGQVKRLTAAVVVNYQNAVDEKGVPITKGMTPEQIAQMTALVRESIGFNPERGDSVNLMNTPFQADTAKAVDVPLWKQPETLELARSFAWPVGIALFAGLVLLGLVRPAIKALTPPPPNADGSSPQALDALEAEIPDRPALTAPGDLSPEQHRLEEARALARQNPIAVANIVKAWVNGE